MSFVLHSLPPSPLAFPDQANVGPFAPLGTVPRRHVRSRVFFPNFELPTEDAPTEDRPAAVSPMRRAVIIPRRSASASPSCSSLSTGPSFSSASLTTSSRPSAIILANGKVLKPSLKSQNSSPVLPEEQIYARHARVHSMPETPSAAKSVQFKDSALESVRVFRTTGRPASLLVASAEDTETETESEAQSYPFPATYSFLEIDPNPERTSHVPTRAPPSDVNVRLESLTLPLSRSPVLHGTVLVRNVAFEKSVAVRFTRDDWETVSEVHANYVQSFTEREVLTSSPASPTLGDLIGAPPSEDSKTWDRFSFVIQLGNNASRTLLLAARFNAAGGEWWDNNAGENYRISFRTSTASPSATTLRTRKRSANTMSRCGQAGLQDFRASRGWSTSRW
ncbi:putative phosphatase regulatory subunit-domain-containing protein [Gloeopeniophorella convolvens]|nr:putative phosphatase regulatory subunit-domain-containing protein [Gloeopeniophorella convolvens]